MAVRDNIGVIIVCYNPTETDKQYIATIASEYKGVVVDNTVAAVFSANAIHNMRYLPLHANMGIAEAQNRALDVLLNDSSIEYVVFLDQDSRTGIEYPSAIVAEYQRIRKSHTNIGLLGPTVDNISTGEEYRSVVHVDMEAEDGFVQRRDVISSGSVVSRDVLENVGFNDSALFIDFVDFEWCWRAEAKGYVCGITRKVHIKHQVGSRELSFGAYKVIISAPIRYFYQYRNHLWLCRRGYVPMQWKVANGIKHLARLFYFPIMVKGGIMCWKNMWKGIWASFHKP